MPDTSKIVAAILVVIAVCLTAYYAWGQFGTLVKMPKYHSVFLQEKATLEVKPPQLPDISGFTIDNIAKNAPAYSKGVVEIRQMRGLHGLKEFLELDGRLQLARLSQMRVIPRTIYIAAGNYDWKHLYEEVVALNPDAILKDGDVYTLRLPLLIEKGAALVIGPDVKELRLSKEKGALIANTGEFYVIKTKIIGWSEEKNTPAYYEDSKKFRPFLTSWSGAHMHLLGSEIASLGYSKGKSYGISYSHCETCVAEDPSLKRATGTIIGNKFHDMYYGFYCYEADDVAIIGNTYVDNIIYAIDPHDRSRRLIIAKNETYGTKKKHGIILSREVNDSWIFDNYSHNNHGSGIMLDRTSVRNVVANNLAEHNEQDGITFFESQDNMTWGNRLYNNGRNGIKIRNSWNITLANDEVVNNKGVGIDIYIAALEGQETRDFELDPYTKRASATVTGLTIKTRGAAIFKIGQAENVKLSNLFIAPSTTTLFMGNRLPNNLDMIAGLQKGGSVLEIMPESDHPEDLPLLGTIKTAQ